MSKLNPPIWLAMLVTAAIAVTGKAASLAITSAGFEIPAGLAAGTEDSQSGYTVPGWTEYEPSAGPPDNYLWEWDVRNPTPGEGGAQSGTNVLLGYAYDPTTAYVEQVLTNSLQNGMSYSLSAWAADPDGHTPENGARFFLYAGTNLLGVVTNTPVAARSWSQTSLVYSSGIRNPCSGQPLKIRIMHNPGNSYRLMVDTVGLDVEAADTAPPAPTNLTAQLFGATAVNLAWTGAGGDVSGYRIERALGAGGLVVIAGVSSNATTFRDSCLPASTLCTYHVTATNAEFSSTSITASATTSATPAGAIPGQALANVADYGYLWWSNGPAASFYAIKTSRYGMLFNWQALTPTTLFPLSNPAAESTVLTESWTNSFPPTPPVSLVCQATVNGQTYPVSATGNSGDVQLVESGKFFQRRWQKVTLGGFNANTNQSGLEIAAWPDRLSFVLRLEPSNAVATGTLQMTLDLANTYSNLLTSGVGAALAAADGTGFAFLKSVGTSSFSVDSTNSKITVSTVVSNWAANQECSVGLIIYPASGNVAGVLSAAVAAETAPMPVGATGITPAGGPLAVAYDADRGWQDITLPNSGTAGDNEILRVLIAATNSSQSPRAMRLNFDGVPFYIPGIMAVLRDTNLCPVGIPVQLSKNWHNSGAGDPRKFVGPWFHGLTMLTVPAHTSLSFELTMAGENWGGLPAATHSQLSVIGYDDAGDQQWDESALGNYGEALTYDVEHSLTDNDGADSRPMLMLNAGGQTSQWCGNHGGGQFLRYYDVLGKERRHRRMRTQYVRYCPNLTEADFAGQTDDGTMEFSYSAGVYRSDDYTRGVHRLRVNVLSDLSFSRLVFFQQAADTYAYNNGNLLAYGNATNPAAVRQWTATFGQNTNIGTPVALDGPMPWAVTLNSPADPGYTAANRGFVIRSWNARLNGSSNVPPYVVERSVSGASLFDIVPPPGVSHLKAGDFLEAEIVRFYVPESAGNYYGPNANLRQALTNYQNTCQLALREAAGNILTVTPQWGTLESSFPIQIQATNNGAGFTVTGGVGWVPVTITGLSDYRAPVLETKIGGVWTPLNKAVNGNDFWQCDFNAGTGAWEITFTLSLDSTNYADITTLMGAPRTQTLRFRMGGAHPPKFTGINLQTPGQVQLTATGEPGSSYDLLASESLLVPPARWNVVTNGSITANPFILVDSLAMNALGRFYVLRTQ